jgi:hypothetical protein
MKVKKEIEIDVIPVKFIFDWCNENCDENSPAWSFALKMIGGWRANEKEWWKNCGADYCSDAERKEE